MIPVFTFSALDGGIIPNHFINDRWGIFQIFFSPEFISLSALNLASNSTNFLVIFLKNVTSILHQNLNVNLENLMEHLHGYPSTRVNFALKSDILYLC